MYHRLLGAPMGQELWIGGGEGVHFWAALIVGFLRASGSSPWMLWIGGCGFFGLRSFAACGLGWWCCCFRILWCDCFGFVCGLVRGVGCGYGGFGVFFLSGDIHGGISKYPCVGLLLWMFLGGGDIRVLSLRSGSALLADLWTGFGAVAPGDVRR